MLGFRKLLLLVTALALVAASCARSETETADAETTTAEEVAAEEVAEETTEEGVSAETAEPDASTGEEINGGKPDVEIAGGASPSELVIDDLIVGDGDVAANGDLLVMHYVGVLFDDGTQFDASWDRGDTFSFVLGAGNVIEGWDEGIVDMTVGSRRQLTIPADLAYGDNSPSPDIPAGATLVFVVDLVAAHTPHEVDTATENTTESEVSVVTAGDGAEVAAGDVIEVLYSIALPNDVVVQSSWTDRTTATFTVGLADVDIFAGWSEPLVGRNVGDELRIIVPPELGPNPDAGDAVVSQLTILEIVESAG